MVFPGVYFNPGSLTHSMTEAGPPYTYEELVRLVDEILDACDEDVPCIAKRLEAVHETGRNELFVSDLLNAYQVFYFFFRTGPGELVRERLELNPASSLRGGLLVDETDLLEMYFGMKEGKPVIAVSDGDRIVAAFSGKSAYRQAREFLESPEYQ